MDEEDPAADGPAAAVSAAFDAKLRADDVAFEAADAALLRAVDAAGSLNAAADALDRSYSRAHKRLATLEAAFGSLVDSSRGGSGGGGSSLTPRARQLLARFERLRTEFSGVADVEETVFEGTVVGREGELATVETPAGRLRALAPPDASAVSVTVRADAVTLYDPAAVPPLAATSARNRVEGTVESVTDGRSVHRVALDVGGDRRLVALVTARSRRRLDIAPGDALSASFKTTATRATPTDG